MLRPVSALQFLQVRHRAWPPRALIGTCSSVTVLPEDALSLVKPVRQIGQAVLPRSYRLSRLLLPVFRDMPGDHSLGTPHLLLDVSPKNDDKLALEYGGVFEGPRTERMGPMKRSTFSEEQVAYALRQAEAGTAVADVCRPIGVSDATFYVWKKKYAHLGVSERRRVRQLEEENTRLKRRVADLSLDKHMLSEALRKKV